MYTDRAGHLQATCTQLLPALRHEQLSLTTSASHQSPRGATPWISICHCYPQKNYLTSFYFYSFLASFLQSTHMVSQPTPKMSNSRADPVFKGCIFAAQLACHSPTAFPGLPPTTTYSPGGRLNSSGCSSYRV